MENFVDLTGEVTFSESQIRKRLLAIERNRYSARDEQVLNRVASGLALGVYTPTPDEQQQITEFNTFMAEMVVFAAQVRADNSLLQSTIALERAQDRLARYILLDGRQGVVYQPAVYDDVTGELISEEVQAAEAIPPLPEFVDQTQEDGTTIQIRNPLVEQDETERAEALAIVDGASVEVLDLAALRAN